MFRRVPTVQVQANRALEEQAATPLRPKVNVEGSSEGSDKAP